MARPEKDAHDKRDHVLRVRLKLSEKNRIWTEAKDAGLTPSDFARIKMIGTKPIRNVPTLERELLLNILSELNKNGSNLNQMARALNRKQESIETAGIDLRYLDELIKYHDEVTRLLMDQLLK